MKEQFSHWDTTPVKVKHAYKPDNYTSLEWKLKQTVDHIGDSNWESSGYESDLSKLEI